MLVNSAGTVVALQNDISSGTDCRLADLLVYRPDKRHILRQSAESFRHRHVQCRCLSFHGDASPRARLMPADYYNVTLAAGDAISVGLKLLAVGTVHVGLWDPASSNWISGTPGTTGANWDETIRDYVAPAAGQYVLKIAGVTSSQLFTRGYKKRGIGRGTEQHAPRPRTSERRGPSWEPSPTTTASASRSGRASGWSSRPGRLPMDRVSPRTTWIPDLPLRRQQRLARHG